MRTRIAIVLLASASAFTFMSAAASADGSLEVHVKAATLTDHACDATEWHFVVTQASQAPSSIAVTWATGQRASVRLDSVSRGMAHYRTPLLLDRAVIDAVATLAPKWTGQFNLSHGPCGLPASAAPTPTPVPSASPSPTPTPSLAAISIAPASATITAGGSQTLIASGTDQFGKALAVTPTWSASSPDVACVTDGATAACRATKAGAYMITASSGAITANASLTVTAADPVSVKVDPTSATVAAGTSRSYTVHAFDAANNDLGDVTSTTAFTIAPKGSDTGAACTGSTCTATKAGTYTVTATYAGKTATSSLEVSQPKPSLTPTPTPAPAAGQSTSPTPTTTPTGAETTTPTPGPTASPVPTPTPVPAGVHPVVDVPVVTVAAVPASLPAGTRSTPLQLIVAADGGPDATNVPVTATLDGAPLAVSVTGRQPVGGGRSRMDLSVEIPQGVASGLHDLVVCLAGRTRVVECTGASLTIELPSASPGVLGVESGPTGATSVGPVTMPIALLPSSSTVAWGVLALLSIALAFVGVLARPTWAVAPGGHSRPAPVAAAVPRAIRRLDGGRRIAEEGPRPT